VVSYTVEIGQEGSCPITGFMENNYGGVTDMERIKSIKAYIPTIIKYAFAMAFLIVVSAEMRDVRYLLFGLAELFFVFA
jgi:hypothetical protein